MNRIDTSQIVDPSILQPFTGPSLKFLQDSSEEMLGAIMAGISPLIFDYGIPVMIYGGQKSFVSGTTYLYQPGYLYVGDGFGGIVYFPGGTVNLASNTDVIALVTTNDAIDPITFTDGIPRNVHHHITAVIQNGVSGSTFVNSNGIVFVHDTWHNVGATGEPAFQGGWANVNTTTMGYLSYTLTDGGNWLEMSGNVYGGASGSVVFTLPPTHRPAYNYRMPTTRYDMYLVGGGCSNIEIKQNGEVWIYYTGTISNGFSMDGIRA